MRILTFGAIATQAAVLAACCTNHGGPPPPPPPPPGACLHNPGNGPPASSVGYGETIVNVAREGPWVLKPRGIALLVDPGLCVEGQNGDIHLYHKAAKEVVITLTFDPSLTGAHWPADPSVAFSAPGQDMTQPPQVSPDQAALTLHLRPMGLGQSNAYTMHYLDGQMTLHQTEPMIRNH